MTEQPMTVMLHPSLVPAFRSWLASSGLRLGRLPLDLRVSVESEPVWIVTPDEWPERLAIQREAVHDEAECESGPFCCCLCRDCRNH